MTSYIISLDSLDECHKAWQCFLELVVDGSDCRYGEDGVEPSSDGGVVVEGDFIDQQVGNFVEDLKVSDGEMVSSDEGGLSLSENGFKSLQAIMHLHLCLFQLFCCQLLAAFDLSVELEQNDAQCRRSEAGLSPCKMLVHNSLALRTDAIVLAQLLRKGLTEVNKDSIALSKLKVTMHQEWNLPMWILAKIFRTLGLSLQQVHIDKLSFKLTEVNSRLDGSCRLTDKVPIKSDHI